MTAIDGDVRTNSSQYDFLKRKQESTETEPESDNNILQYIIISIVFVVGENMINVIGVF